MEEQPGSRLPHLSLATFASGCFWCTEAVYLQFNGVHSVVSGYSGGRTPDPTYENVCSGSTGHAECVQIAFDPAQITYEQLLEVFWSHHDPTTLNRQGHDIGTQYRSAIFYHDEAQRATAERSRETAQRQFTNPIVTEIVPLQKFYQAEPYHQNYFNSHSEQKYCLVTIRPKVDLIRARWKPQVRKSIPGSG